LPACKRRLTFPLRASLLFILLLAPATGPAHPTVVRIPFRTSQTMILVQGRVNGDAVLFLLDTGSIGTIVSTRIYRITTRTLQSIQRNARGPGVNGQSISVRLEIQLGTHRWLDQRVAVMNLDELSEILGVQHIDGLIGQDLLREFRAVRIDYQTHIIELEE
jgi:hypothetical protein